MTKHVGESQGRSDYINDLPTSPQIVHDSVRAEDYPTFTAEPEEIGALGDLA